MICSKDPDGQQIQKEFSEAYAGRFAVSPECTDGLVHEYLSMLITIDRSKGEMTFRMPKLFKKLRAMLESMGDRARKRGRFCRKERIVRGEVVGSSAGCQNVVRSPMTYDHSDIYELSSEDNPVVPYDVFDSRRILGLAAYIILGIRPLGVRFFLKELDLLKLGASTVLTDNKASMEGVQNDKNHKGSHYMGYRLSWLREQVADLLVRFDFVDSKSNVADIFTKVLAEEDFIRLRAILLNLQSKV